MKNLFFSAFLALSASSSFAQVYVNGKEINLDSIAYLELQPVQILENRIRFQIDYGQPSCTTPFNWDRCMVTDSEGRQLRFNSEIAGLNFFWQQGWEIQEVFVVSEDQKMYLLRRRK